jgi:type II secretory pathway pseudopilin PulG
MIRSNKGFIYIWVLFSVALSGVVLAGIGQVWQTKAQREKEKELLFVGDQFRKAIMSYYNNEDSELQKFPESLEDLVQDNRSSETKRHLRKIYPDPITKSYEWGLIKEPISEQSDNTGFLSREGKGIIGVYSLSKNIPLKSDNFPEDYYDFSKADSYQDWKFIFLPEEASDKKVISNKKEASQSVKETKSEE